MLKFLNSHISYNNTINVNQKSYQLKLQNPHLEKVELIFHDQI